MTSTKPRTDSRNSAREAPRALGGAVVENEQLAAGPVEASHDRAVATAARVLAHALVHTRADVGRAIERERLDEHLDRASARETDLPRVLVAQIHLEQTRAHRAENVFGFFDDLCVDAAADRDRAQHATALAHQHLGALLARSGAAGIHEGGDRDAPAGAP
jgi:hypothetical protein